MKVEQIINHPDIPKKWRGKPLRYPHHFWAWVWGADKQDAEVRIVVDCFESGSCLAVDGVGGYMDNRPYYQVKWSHFEHLKFPEVPKEAE